MELVKCCEFVYEISVSLAWLTHTGSKKSCLSKRPAKAAQWGLVWGSGVVSLLRRRKPHTGPYRRSCRGPIREEICLQQKNRRRQHFSLTAPAILYGILPVYTFIPAFSASRTRRHLCCLPAGWLPRQSMAGCCRQIPESRLVRSPTHRCQG